MLMIVVLLLGVCVAPTYSAASTITTCVGVASNRAQWLFVKGMTDGSSFTITSSYCAVGSSPQVGIYLSSSSYSCPSVVSGTLQFPTCGNVTGSQNAIIVCTSSAFATSPFLSVFVVLVSLVLAAESWDSTWNSDVNYRGATWQHYDIWRESII